MRSIREVFSEGARGQLQVTREEIEQSLMVMAPIGPAPSEPGRAITAGNGLSRRAVGGASFRNEAPDDTQLHG